MRVFDEGIREGIDLQIEIGPSADVNSEIFERYCDTVLIPAAESSRTIEGCQNKPAISNCKAHCLEDLLKKLVRHGILVLAYLSHTSHMFQVLDVLFFGTLKRAKKIERRDDRFTPEVDQILPLFRVCEKVITSTTVRISWNRTGFGFERRDCTTYLAINETKIRQSPGFREIWEFDTYAARLTDRRLSQNWGWISKHLFRKNELRMMEK
jgi:hypothetical protein